MHRREAPSKRILRALGGLALLAASAFPAAAQAPICGQIRAELAQLGNTGGGGATRESQRYRTELSRIRLALQQNDCGRTGFLGLGGPPPVCGPLRQQAAQYEAQIRAMEGGGGNPRRAQLIAALERYGCLGPQQAAPQQRGVIYAAPNEPSLFERLFGDDGRRYNGQPLDGETLNDLEPPKERLGGRMAICVRTCDGFYFPVNFEGIGARDEYAQVCQSLCPAAETQVYFMPLGADVERAATRDGTPYMSLPAAKKFQQSRDLSCVCKQPGQTWASAMKGVEDLVEARKGDIVVTEEQALQMSRPKGLAAAANADRRKRAPAAPVEPEAPASLPESQLPTGGTASSGIGPRITRERIVTSEGGTRQKMTSADGKTRVVRNVAPELTGKERPIDLRGEARP